MIIKKQNWVAVINGKRGSGKSTLTSELILDFPRVFVIDNIGEYDNINVVNGFAECVNAIVEASKKKRFRLSLRTDSISEDLALIKLAQTVPSCLLVIEEASKYQSSAYMPPEIEHLIRYGRHLDISQVYISRRARELNRDITANADNIITFRQQEPRDIAYLREFLEDDADIIPKLKQYHVYVWGDTEQLPISLKQRIVRQRGR